jgi:vacuolar-type H+-ATPase subunit H
MGLSIERDRLRADAVEMKGRFEAAEQETKGRIEAADRDARRRIEAAEEETKRRIDTAEEAFQSQGSLISKLEGEASALRSVSTTIP